MKKIKGSLNKPNPILFISVAMLSLCVLLPIRVYQTASLIDPQTGFFSRFSFTTPLFFVLGAAVIAFLMGGSYLNSRICRTRSCMTANKALGIVAALVALAIMFDAAMSAYNFFEMKTAFVPTESTPTPISYLIKTGAVAQLLEGVFGVFSAFFFWIYSLSCFSKSVSMSGFRVLSVAPVIWSIARIVFRFVRKISFVNISDLLLELFMLAFMIAFTLAFAQVVTNVTPEVSAWRLFGCGLPAALLAFLTSVPRLFLVALGHSDMLVKDYGFNPCDTILAVFIPLFLYFTTTAKSKKQAESK